MASELNGIQVAARVAGAEYGAFRVEIEEAIDGVPSLTAKLFSEAELPKPASILNAPVELSIAGITGGAPRAFKGVVTAAERRIDGDGHPYLIVHASPLLFRLGKRSDVRTFQKMTIDAVVKQVMEGAGAGKHRFSLTGSYAEREYLVQYRETDLDFLLRVLSEEGISFVFDHDAEETVFFDDPSGIGDAQDKTMPYRPEFGFEHGAATVAKVSETARVVADKVLIRDYDFTRPRFTLEADAEGTDDGEHALEVYTFPARTNDEAVLKRWAQVLLDSVQSRRLVIEGATTSWSLAPGLRFSIEEHPFEDLNTELLVTATSLVHEVAHREADGPRARTHASFRAMRRDKSSYRPERRARARSIPGIQTGKTTGAPGQEIHVDEHGRVNVIFPWDRVGEADDTASLPMRTLQLPTGGSMLLPRVGWEVMVQHDEGDVDLPLVVARLYNAETPPPYALPEGAAKSSLQTATTPGGGSTNELRTSDTKGSEEMFFNASKDMTMQVNHNATESVGNNATKSVGGNQTLDITNSLTTSVGANRSLDVGGNMKTSVETFSVDDVAGDLSYTIGGNRDMKVGGDHKHTVTGSETIDVGSIKTDLVVGKVSETVGGNATLGVDALRVTLTAGDSSIEIGGNHDETISLVKGVVSFAGVASDAGGTAMTKIGGAQLNLIDGDKSETAGATLTKIAGGAAIIKADNIAFEADAAITLVMGASIISLTPASVAILGVSLKIDGATTDTAAIVLDN